LTTFHLKAVEYEGKRFANCTLVLDPEARKAEVKRPAGVLRGGMVPLADLSWSRGTTVQVDGDVVRSGPVTFIADDAKMADEISRALQGLGPAGGTAADKLASLKDPTWSFLRMRAEGIAYLVELKRDPRRALVEKSPSFTGRYENPALEYLMKFATTLSESHAKMTYASAEVQEAVGTDAIDRIMAFVCATGSYQNSFVAGTGYSQELGDFLSELGLESEPLTEGDVKSGTESMLRRSLALFSPRV
jgi:hypothetical protein